jgi:hypothetical protein
MLPEEKSSLRTARGPLHFLDHLVARGAATPDVCPEESCAQSDIAGGSHKVVWAALFCRTSGDIVYGAALFATGSQVTTEGAEVLGRPLCWRNADS